MIYELQVKEKEGLPTLHQAPSAGRIGPHLPLSMVTDTCLCRTDRGPEGSWPVDLAKYMNIGTSCMQVV
jgi:hypothetical protein